MKKGATEDEMVGWHQRLNGHEFEQTPGDSEGQGSLACYSQWGRKESDMTERLKNNSTRDRVCCPLCPQRAGSLRMVLSPEQLTDDLGISEKPEKMAQFRLLLSTPAVGQEPSKKLRVTAECLLALTNRNSPVGPALALGTSHSFL